MNRRFDIMRAAPDALKAMLAVSDYVNKCGLEPSLLHLVKLRASQINGCANCIHMHFHEALADGDTADRLILLDAWRETDVYSPRERAALAWTEALTLVAETRAPDDVYETVRSEFSEAETMRLSVAITTINAWNRLAIGARVHPQVAVKAAA
ncbi:carboxymuconolactone decarboxylase family protein [Chelatococcus sambhunathii]|uniref:Carboxymuconolactone decarboxylase family protein n=1 Tax=Chelatococcus sambhunathii TaxID=363953 RepID=A0ABU1DAI5_9HYPH|nr:carboxymuconolactone decarboxylase family protein [Chelatococcus sambhunathii]MDR4305123.1 carboxymuconolactone decarboxylase family protein [Chelatococcus sambhunathii]